MLSIIKEITNPLIAYLKDDPVRPEIPAEFRVSGTRFIGALVKDKPLAMVCVSLHDFIPTTVEELMKESKDPTTSAKTFAKKQQNQTLDHKDSFCYNSIIVNN